MKRHKTLIAEDEPLARDGLADWVRQLPQLELWPPALTAPAHWPPYASCNRRWC